MTQINRRNFLLGSAALGGSLATNFGISSISFAANPGKTIIKIFQGGGACGLNLFPPYADINYYNYRPNIAIEPPSGSDPASAIRLDSYYGMNPNLRPMMEIWDAGRLAICPGTHFDNSSRSHFENQKRIKTGANGNKSLDGYLKRYLENSDLPEGVFNGVRAGSTQQDPVFSGTTDVPVINDANSFSLRNWDLCEGSGCSDNKLTESILDIGNNVMGTTVERMIRGTGSTMVKAIDRVKTAADNYTPTTGNAEYSNFGMGRGLKLIAQLLKDGVPIEVASVNFDGVGWDTHENLVPNGKDVIDDSVRYNRGLKTGADDLLAFYRDLGPLLNDVIVIVGTEFGRTTRENGTRGTDHGHASAWFAFGGPTRGGIYKPFNTVEETSLKDGRYIPKTLDYKDILGEAMMRHLGMPQNLLSRVFPGHKYQDEQIFTRQMA